MTETLRGGPYWELAQYDAHDQAELVRKGELAPEALVEAALSRIDEADGDLNSVSYRAFDHALDAAGRLLRRAPVRDWGTMASVPYLLKASIEYPGFPTVSGSRARQKVIGSTQFPFTQALDRAGLIPVGMSTMPEFGLLVSGEALVYGPTRNPWDLHRGPGGSSSGAAAAVAAGLVPLAHASDSAGSIRIPASHCGVVGFKPSRSWNVRARASNPIQDILCSDTLLARSMRDVTWAARHVRPEGLQIRDRAVTRRLRIALDLRGLDGRLPEPDVAAVIRRSAELCAHLGHHVEELRPPLEHEAALHAITTLWLLLGSEVVDFYKSVRPHESLEDLLEPWTLGLAAQRHRVTPESLAAAYGAFGLVREAAASFSNAFDIVLSPAAHAHAPLIGELAPTRAFEELWSAIFEHAAYTPLHNIAGTPSISLPLFTAEHDAPVGTLISAGPGEDETLLQLAAELEEAHPWKDRWPAATSVSRAPDRST